MASTTLIRVKRRRSQSPADALLVHLAPKRPRSDGSGNVGKSSEPGPESGPKPKIFRFATTVTDPEKAADEKSLYEFVGNKVSEQKLETPVRSTKNTRTPVKVNLNFSSTINHSQLQLEQLNVITLITLT